MLVSRVRHCRSVAHRASSFEPHSLAEFRQALKLSKSFARLLRKKTSIAMISIDETHKNFAGKEFSLIFRKGDKTATVYIMISIIELSVFVVFDTRLFAFFQIF